jgi:hypothetical protein
MPPAGHAWPLPAASPLAASCLHPAGSTSINACSCPGGSVLDITAELCKCPANEYKDGNTCYSCPTGSTSSAGER